MHAGPSDTTVESEKRGEFCPERHASLVAPAARGIVMASGRLSCPTRELLFEHRLGPRDDVRDVRIFSGTREAGVSLVAFFCCRLASLER